MTRRGQAILVMHAVGLLCVGLAIPGVAIILGALVASIVRMEPLPEYPGESGYLLVILRRMTSWFSEWLDVLWLGRVVLVYSRTILPLVAAVFLLRGRPSWLRRRLERCFQ